MVERMFRVLIDSSQSSDALKAAPAPQLLSLSTSFLTISESWCSTGTARFGMYPYLAVDKRAPASPSYAASSSSCPNMLERCAMKNDENL